MIKYKDYYLQVLSNLQKNKIFYKYFEKNYSYADTHKYSCKLLKFLKKRHFKNKTIVTFSNKSFEMYSSIFPILVSGNIWVPLSINLPLEKIKNVIKETKPAICFFDYSDKKKLDYLKSKVECINFKKVYNLKKKKISFVNEIDSQHAFAYWDKEKRTLALSRDHVGIKPLYYRFRPNGLVFASDKQAIG